MTQLIVIGALIAVLAAVTLVMQWRSRQERPVGFEREKNQPRR